MTVLSGDAENPARLLRAGRPVDPDRLIAHSAPIDPQRLSEFRALARQSGRVIEHDGLQVLSLFEAARIELRGGIEDKSAPRCALQLLRAIGVDQAAPARRAPLALGALPFSGASPAELVVPGVVVRVAPGETPVATVIGPQAELASLLGRFPFSTRDTPPLLGEHSPEHFALASERSHEDYRELVRGALRAIGSGVIDKVVLAREVTVDADCEFPRRTLVGRLRQLHPSCATYAVDGFVGASPELLVRKSGPMMLSQPLAGTVGRSGDPDEDARLAAGLLSSDKDLAEHGFVVDAIVSGLLRLGASVPAPQAPHLLELRNVVHLATRIEASFSEDHTPEVGALEVVAALHPTPAVGGMPRDAALEFLARHEHLDRGLYGGPVGWFDADGDGEFFIGIRCAMLDGSRARLLAGAGIVAGSDPELELAETQLKLQALLAAAVRP